MASSHVCNHSYRGEMIQLSFTAKCKLSLSLLLFLLTLPLARLDYADDDPADPLVANCGADKFMNGSASERNLKVVLRSLVDNVNKTGFYISSHGENGDKIYGLVQCRGDLNASTCQACVSNATQSVPEKCGGSISIHLSGCFLEYNSSNFYLEPNLSDAAYSVYCDDVKKNSTPGTGWNLGWKMATLLKTLIDNAVSSNASYSTLNDSGVYYLAQCWKDLSVNQCNQCLNGLYNSLGPGCPLGTREGYALGDNCVLRYVDHKFYGDGVPLLSQPQSTDPPRAINGSGSGLSRATHEGKSSPNLPLMLGLSIGGVVSVAMLLGLVVVWKRKVINTMYLGYNKPSSEHSTAISRSKINYKFQTLQIATKKFNPTNKIGQGGFGSVYKGVLPDGREIAVKRLFANREQSVRDFFNEVDLISRVQHKNLLNLLGFSVNGPDKFLIYEYLPNKSLDHFLYDENVGKLLDWQRRFEIILGTASGLAYLHQESDIRIIHRDIKASNILLDQHFKPKIADFGLVRHFAEDQTHVSTAIVGTRGYMPPEYLMHGQLTEKVDVYAFGVLVLEIISGRKNVTPIHVNDMPPSVLTVIWNHYLSGTISNIIDPNIEEKCHDEVLHVVQVALLCTQASARLRPSMSEAIVFLTRKNPNLPAATQPPFLDFSDSESNTNTSFTANELQQNSTTGVAAALETYNPVLNIASSSLATTATSLNTISKSSFGPR